MKKIGLLLSALVAVAIPCFAKNASPTSDKFCGFFIEGFRFTITSDGRYWVASSPKDSGGTGLTGQIAGFEYEMDGFPPYYTTPSFDVRKISQIPYEEFLASVSLDDQEKHSGTYSMKLVNDGRTSRWHAQGQGRRHGRSLGWGLAECGGVILKTGINPVSSVH